MSEWRDIEPEDHDFTNASVGDVVYGLVDGKGTIVYVGPSGIDYPIEVVFRGDESTRDGYTKAGRRVTDDAIPSLFKRPVKVVIREEDEIDRRIEELQRQLDEIKELRWV